MSKTRSGGLLVGMYVVALLAGVVAGALVDGPAPWPAVVGSLVATAVVFVAGLWLGNASAYDPYWSVAPPVLGVWWALGGPEGGLRSWLALGLTFAWGYRLTASFWRGWPGFGHEDWRYGDLRQQTGRFFPVVNLLGIHYFPTVCTFTGSLPLLVIGGSSASLGWLDLLGALVAASAITIEAVADTQLHHFKRAGHPPGTILETGLWRWSRHPNYFGEISFWWGLALLGWSAGGAQTPWWNWLGAGIITALFVGVSIPLIEKRMAARRPGWADYCRRTSVLIPLPPR